MGTVSPHQMPPCDELQLPSKRVLVVDDEPAIQFAYRKLIKAEGFEVDSCEELQEALRLISSCVYYAVITDIRLSGTDNSEGIFLAHAVRTQQPDAKVIVITGYGNNEIERALQELGASRYFEKPVKPALIIEYLKAETNTINRSK